jgi:hypothetical protein
MHNMTLAEAQELKKKTIRAAQKRNLAIKIKHLCLTDATDIDSGVYTRPLAGAGVFLKYRTSLEGGRRNTETVTVELSQRPGKEIFRARCTGGATWEISRCRYGVWTDKLDNEYARVTFRQGNKTVVDLYEGFGPLPNGKVG